MPEKGRHWIQQAADEVEAYVDLAKPSGEPIVCASGISPSGPVHVGNLREVMTVHLIAEELRRRGRHVDHVHSWDDYDRLRKVPQGIPPEFEEHIGRPLSQVPDPLGEYDSFASRFISEFESALSRLAIHPRYVRQSEAYKSGVYTPLVLRAMERRLEIFDILREYQTRNPQTDVDTDISRRSEYFPFKVYCQDCGRDTTQVDRYSEQTSELSYRCLFRPYSGSFVLRNRVEGKPPWKVDWPLRWSHERVDFEPGGLDHAAPGSSYTVGQRIVSTVFGGRAPKFIGYAFVGMAGRSKMSSSAGAVATPRAALDILEPAILRWLYIRRQPAQQFDINFGHEVWRLYDEWDAFVNRVRAGSGSEVDTYTYSMCLETSAGRIEQSEIPVPFRVMASSADITQGNRQQLLRIVNAHLQTPWDSDEQLERNIEPRLSCAINWAVLYQPEDERTAIRAEFDPEAFGRLPDSHRYGIELLRDRLDSEWTLQGLSGLIYGIPKLLVGRTQDAEPDDVIREAQRSFFRSLYELICGKDTGPRLPTLFLSIGRDKVHQLLTPQSESNAAREFRQN
ncbi:MAG: lysine--tRNA ligase [Chloroflexota bacterium]